MTKITYIPGEIANAAIDEHGNRKPVTRTHHIFDDAKDKNQAEVNAEVDDTFAFHQSEINALNSQNYVTVDSFSSLPATGAVDTVYRVSNWDGTQQDPSVYSEYAWNGSQYVHLSTKTQIGEVFDISAYHATGGEIAKYADLASALGTNGANIPKSLRKGGMSVKFVHSVDNNYVQATCMAQNFTTDVTQWQGVDGEPTAGSNNLVKSGGVAEKVCEKIEKGSLNTDIFSLGIDTIKGYIDINTGKPNGNASCITTLPLYLNEGDYVVITSNTGFGTAAVAVGAYDENGDIISSSCVLSKAENSSIKATAENGIRAIRISIQNNSTYLNGFKLETNFDYVAFTKPLNDAVKTYKENTDNDVSAYINTGEVITDINKIPSLSNCAILFSNGSLTTNSVCNTSKLIKLSVGDSVKISAYNGFDAYAAVAFYDENLEYLPPLSVAKIVSNLEVEATNNNHVAYMRICQNINNLNLFKVSFSFDFISSIKLNKDLQNFKNSVNPHLNTIDERLGELEPNVEALGNIVKVDESNEYKWVLLDSNKVPVLGIKSNNEMFYGINMGISKQMRKEDAIIRGGQISKIGSIGNPTILISTKDGFQTSYDNIMIHWSNVLKISDSMYYMYYNALGTDTEVRPGSTEPKSWADCTIMFAYSTDGRNWHRGFPEGIVPPFAGKNFISVETPEGESSPYALEFHIFKVQDAEYPYRMIGNHNYMNMWKSRDAINFVQYKQILGAPYIDSQYSCIPRGNVIKVYHRSYDYFYDGQRNFYPNQRRIGVMYLDLEGNILSPKGTLFGKCTYQASASVLDDKREILFPTIYDSESQDDVEHLSCYIVDGVNIKELAINEAVLTDNGAQKQIYVIPNIISIGEEQFIYYVCSTKTHSEAFSEYVVDNSVQAIRMAKIELKF